MSTPPGDPYKNAAKEMEVLLKVEGGVNFTDTARNKQKLAQKLAEAGESGTRLSGGAGAASPTSYLANMTDEDFELGLASMPTEAELMRSLTEKAGLPYRDIKQFDLQNEEKVKRLKSYLLAATARERRVFAVEEKPNPIPGMKPILTVAIADPLDITIVDDLRLMLPEHEIEPVVCNEEDIIDAIDRAYGVGEENLDVMIDELKGLEGGSKEGGAREGEVEINLEELANDPPIIKLVNLLLIQAVKDRASDLHIEPFAGSIRIRYRVDGVLREIPSPPKSMQLGLLSRLKVMAGLNISETRKPQDGRIRLNIEGREVDLRVACISTVHGESIVMRVLDKSAMMLGVSQIGMQEEVLVPFLRRCNKPNGMVLVTGPTGSGKTTSLYATLKEIFDPGAKFITTEDPVEFELPGIVQVNINARVGLTFAACLRSILRQDPDVILVGEIRDVETAQISIQAALTGHMVFSTLHTNSAAATITRLIDMGIEPFLLTSTLEAIIGQRLLRTICPNCKTPYIPTDEELSEFGVTREEVEEITFYQGRGCDDCNYSGYTVRRGIFEVLEVTEAIKELILQRATTDDVHAMGVHEGMITLRQDGWTKICLGLTTFEEVSKHTIPETEDSVKAELESVKKSLAMIAKVQKTRDDEDRSIIHDEGSPDEVINLTDSKTQQVDDQRLIE
ncbi:type II/IV secretion system protein [Candidatus Sumerlaeota bacterium]|nr:type II/IV secretion system protein [Candidatus Sumerlaeota bacterium]